MLLLELKLQSFKNYPESKVLFSRGINCILGKNGMGKTNLLDAIFMLSMTKSALGLTDQQLIKHDHDFFALNAILESNGEVMKANLYCERGKRKMLKVNGTEIPKMSEHIGTIPCVITTPDDAAIIQEGSEIRRKLFDMVISQCDLSHLKLLMEYQKILKQRNGLLKSADLYSRLDQTLMEVYDDQLIPINRQIAENRRAFSESFIPYFSENYRAIFNGEEEVTIQYDSESLDTGFPAKFLANRKKDHLLQRTEIGVHKDDFQFMLNGLPIKKFGSQGQQKSFVIALKLAEYDFLRATKGFDPLLLLDDIFDKLDDERIGHLVNLLSDSSRFSQLFISDARTERSREFFSGIDQVSFLEVSNGSVL